MAVGREVGRHSVLRGHDCVIVKRKVESAVMMRPVRRGPVGSDLRLQRS